MQVREEVLVEEINKNPLQPAIIGAQVSGRCLD